MTLAPRWRAPRRGRRDSRSPSRRKRHRPARPRLALLAPRVPAARAHEGGRVCVASRRAARPPCAWRGGALRTRWRRGNAKASISPPARFLPRRVPRRAPKTQPVFRPGASRPRRRTRAPRCARRARRRRGGLSDARRAAADPPSDPIDRSSGLRGPSFVLARALPPLTRPRARTRRARPHQAHLPGARRTCAFARRVVGRIGATGNDVVATSESVDACCPHARGGVVRRRSRARVRHARAEHPRTLRGTSAPASRPAQSQHPPRVARARSPEDAARRHSPVPWGRRRRDVRGRFGGKRSEKEAAEAGGCCEIHRVPSHARGSGSRAEGRRARTFHARVLPAFRRHIASPPPRAALYRAEGRSDSSTRHLLFTGARKQSRYFRKPRETPRAPPEFPTSRANGVRTTAGRCRGFSSNAREAAVGDARPSRIAVRDGAA